MSVTQACLSTALRAFNRCDRVLRRLGRAPPDFDPGRLMRRAARRTGLAEADVAALRESLRRLAEALEREAQLSLFGRLIARQHLAGLLETALRVEGDRRRTPAVAEQRIAAPVFIVGLPRTGTTLLHNLLAQDPATRVPATWESMFPAGYPESPQALSRARRRAAARLAWADRLIPDFRRIHPLGADRPEECVALTAPGFASALFHVLYRVPSYQDWFEADSQAPGFEMHFRILQQLQSRRGPRRWVLKGPGHLFSLEPLLRRYPDARLIQTHRDPLRAIPSIASLVATLRGAFSRRVDPREIGRDCTERLSRALERFLRRRDSLPPGRVMDVAYTELVASPTAAVERIYAHLGWPLAASARAAMQAYLAANPRHADGVHRYSLRAFGLDAKREAERYARYCVRFDLAREAGSADDSETSRNRQEPPLDLSV